MTAELKIGHPAPIVSRVRKQEMYSRNSWGARSNPEKTFAVNSMRLEGDHPVKTARMASTHTDGEGMITEMTPHPRWFKSHATTFAKYGVHPGQGIKGQYMRDPHTGVWFKDTPQRLWNRELEVPEPSSVNKSSKDYVSMNSVSMTIKRMP
eukprot:CAMPEP_0197644368 /NCGR_PEP_ID=MMETSP1338-20131121/17367_1 /TAXON_ID=43686 ORGANISM="Pelagodinium beii, Strain RCC1491" /NCGR_SAMPLE_ID=MMETSP1338 /ASSEMBLY_ACC=CAM_ASM_000754 /LENGTH=150 /DNA_ID=CAMNT_0043217757 /DNA_START=67 /DNA_END=519 /DNA_ORIENTATION=+